uniref:Uncharacterized protein n=1 Tax=Solanum lycopersicum TaxID=4081 RepID=A0A3Q7GY99_SOLLC
MAWTQHPSFKLSTTSMFYSNRCKTHSYQNKEPQKKGIPLNPTLLALVDSIPITCHSIKDN